MVLLSYRRHRFPPPIIQHAIWLYLRFTLSYRDVPHPGAAQGQYPARRRDDQRPHQPRTGVTFVLDNSVAMRWCFENAAHPYADGILKRLADGEDALVPVLWFYIGAAAQPTARYAR
jgi:hypothetical protein